MKIFMAIVSSLLIAFLSFKAFGHFIACIGWGVYGYISFYLFSKIAQLGVSQKDKFHLSPEKLFVRTSLLPLGVSVVGWIVLNKLLTGDFK